MNVTDIEDTLQALIATESGQTTIIANQNGPKPDLPFITILISPILQIGHDVIEQNTDTAITITGQRDFSVSVQAFGDGATQTLVDLMDAFEFPDVRDTLCAGGLIYIDHEAINDTDEILETTIEQRASVLLNCRTNSVATRTNANTGIIEQTDVTQTVKRPDGTTADSSNYLIG